MRRACLALLAVAALSCCSVLGPLATGHLDIESTELQSRIAARFPVNNCKTPLLCAELSNPVLALSEGDDRVGITVDVKITLGPRSRTGRIGLAGRPRYVPEQGQLFLDDLEITQLELTGLPPEYADWVRAFGSVEAQRALQAHPVYTLDDSTVKGALAKRTVSDVRVVGTKLRVSFAGASQ